VRMLCGSNRGARDANPSPQYIVLALLVVQLLANTVSRHNATETSLFDSMNWPWQSAGARSPSASFPFSELRSLLVMGFVRSTAASAAAGAVKFLLMNYLILSQMAMVIAGLASSTPPSPPPSTLPVLR
jgi:hypothetical protein